MPRPLQVGRRLRLAILVKNFEKFFLEGQVYPCKRVTIYKCAMNARVKRRKEHEQHIEKPAVQGRQRKEAEALPPPGRRRQGRQQRPEVEQEPPRGDKGGHAGVRLRRKNSRQGHEPGKRPVAVFPVRGGMRQAHRLHEAARIAGRARDPAQQDGQGLAPRARALRRNAARRDCAVRMTA